MVSCYSKFMLFALGFGVFSCVPISVCAMEKDEHEIFKSINNGDEEKVLTFLKHENFDCNITNAEGKPLLHVAVFAGKKNIVDLLLEHKCDVNVEDDQYYRNSLHVACQSCSGATPEILVLLLSRGAHVNSQNGSGLTPLHYAANKGIGFIKPLVEYGANLSLVDAFADATPLCGMLECGDLESIKFIADFYNSQRFVTMPIQELWNLIPEGEKKREFKNKILCFLLVRHRQKKQAAVGQVPKFVVYMIFNKMLAEAVFVRERVSLDKLIDKAYTSAKDNKSNCLPTEYDKWIKEMNDLDTIVPYFEKVDWDCSLLDNDGQKNDIEVENFDEEENSQDENAELYNVILNDDQLWEENEEN